MILKSDCKYFPGDRPCTYNKLEGVKCDACPHYKKITGNILIIKLDAVGDVLRTTCILHGLKDMHPGGRITWITRKESVQLFRNNELVDRVLDYASTEAVLNAGVEKYDLVINMDASYDSAVFASMVKGGKKLGYGIDDAGNLFPFNEEAVAWLEMGAFDELKKANKRSYQDIMLEICGLKGRKKEIVLKLSEEELSFARNFTEQHKVSRKSAVIGLNTGASGRWQFKQWTLEGFSELIEIIVEKTDATVLLYGGPGEKERNERLSGINKNRVVNTGCGNSLREFFALITLSDIFVTGDTLALHAAAALKKKIIAFFGPTSAAEIDSYGGLITKVQSDLDCLVCYKAKCDFNPNCMNSITPERVFGLLKNEMAKLKK
jgi:ADP-heptose:LPS heptosyltransferase